MKDFIQRMKAKPEQVRRRIAFGTSVGVTGLIGLIWFTTMATTGAFALTPKNGEVASEPKEAPIALTGTNVKSNFSQLMGAVDAATNGSSSNPSLTIIDGHTSSTFDTATTTNPSATVLAF